MVKTAMNLDLKKKLIFLVVGTLVIILFYQLVLYKNSNVHNFWVEEQPLDSKKKVVHFSDESHHSHDNISEANNLKEKVKVLCWVMTSPANHQSRAVHVFETWAKRCNKVLFATESSKDGKGLPLLIINTTEGRDHLTAKTMQTFDYLFTNHLNEFDWFLKADDDTYVILENMRYFLSGQDPNRPIFFGHHFKPYVSQGYFSGGAGYILSREALRHFGQRSIHDCKKDEGAEDVEMGLCMQKLGVVTGDSRDALGRSRFHCFNPETHIHGGYPDWYMKYDKYGAKQGIESISDYAITFHYVSVEQMYNLEFFIYHLRPFGIISGSQDLNVKNDNNKNDKKVETHFTPSTIRSTPSISPSQPSTSSSPPKTVSMKPSFLPVAKRKRKRQYSTIDALFSSS